MFEIHQRLFSVFLLKRRPDRTTDSFFQCARILGKSMRAALVNPEAKGFIRANVCCPDPNRGFRYCVRIGFRFRQHRCDMANEAVSLVFEVGCKRQRIVLGLNNEKASETGIPNAGMRKCIPKQSFAFSQRLCFAACNDQLCLWCYWISDHDVGSAILYPACPFGCRCRTISSPQQSRCQYDISSRRTVPTSRVCLRAHIFCSCLRKKLRASTTARNCHEHW